MMRTCRDITRQATAFDEGGLSWRERAAFRLHVFMCRHCARYLAQLRLVRDRTSDLPRDSAPADAKRRALDAFRQRSDD